MQRFVTVLWLFFASVVVAYAQIAPKPVPTLPLSVANGGTGVTTSTGSGSAVLSTSPTLTTPNLGVATATSINGVVLDNNSWTTYTPTVSASSGTLTTYSVSGRYKTIGKNTFYRISITLTDIGSATGSLSLSLPSTPTTSFTASGVESAINAFTLSAITSGSAVIVRKYDGSSIFTNGYVPIVTGFYESP